MRVGRSTTPAAGAALLVLLACASGLAETADGPTRASRAPWTTSKIRGEPDPPAPYVAVPAFPLRTFEKPILFDALPGSDRLVVAELGGKVRTFRPDPASASTDLAIDLKAHRPTLTALYGLAFHPRFQENRFVYVCYVTGDKRPDGTRLSRFRATAEDPPRIDPGSERLLLTWLSGGHNGGCLAFGPDGYLYVSAGDAEVPDPPDPLRAGQDMSTFLSKVLRIDVDREEAGRPYRVPPDNPFVGRPGMLGEIWALGFRNPWKMSFDPESGDLWLGDVGWERWELAHRVERGGNYGWSVMEGRQPVHPDWPVGPTPILPPVVDHPHSEAASVTGGYVYHGNRFPELKGAYVYGDFQTGIVWALRYDRGARRVVEHREIARTPLQLVAFGVDHSSELYLVDYERTHQVYRLDPNPAAGADRPPFPRTLGETGLFASTKDFTPAPGVTPYEINATSWADGRTSTFWMAVPGAGAVEPKKGLWKFPEGSVLVKTVCAETTPGDPTSRVRIETQVLHREDGSWRPYTYAWDEGEADATLVPADGLDRTITLDDPTAPGGRRETSYRYASRAECLLCHNPWAGDGLLFGRQSASPLTANTPQLNAGGQFELWRSIGLMAWDAAGPAIDGPRLANPHDRQAGTDARARAYLQANCAHCHRFGGGGAVTLKLNEDLPLDKLLAIDEKPMRGDFGLADARIVAPGNPYRSVLLYRMAKTGGGRMPHIGSRDVDVAGLDLIETWIRGLGHGKRIESSKVSAEAIPDDPSSALALARAIDRGGVSAGDKSRLLALAKDHPRPEVRELFDRFRPASERAETLGGSFDPAAVLRLAGDPDRGRALFRENAAIQCRSCHVLEGVGLEVGPDIVAIGQKYDRAQLLGHLIRPSMAIDDKYRTYVLETKDGRAISGLLVEKSSERVTLRDAKNEVTKVATAEIGRLEPSPASLMPEGLLSGLTARQAADLLEYLRSRKP